MRRLALLAATLAAVSACGSSGDGDGGGDERVTALKRALGPLRGARVQCEEKHCSVIAPMRLSSNYTAMLVAAPVVEATLADSDLDEVEAISVTLDDEAKQQVFSLRCETGKLEPPVTVELLRTACHSIYT
jgi:hypothetical protein